MWHRRAFSNANLEIYNSKYTIRNIQFDDTLGINSIYDARFADALFGTVLFDIFIFMYSPLLDSFSSYMRIRYENKQHTQHETFIWVPYTQIQNLRRKFQNRILREWDKIWNIHRITMFHWLRFNFIYYDYELFKCIDIFCDNFSQNLLTAFFIRGVNCLSPAFESLSISLLGKLIWKKMKSFWVL